MKAKQKKQARALYEAERERLGLEATWDELSAIDQLLWWGEVRRGRQPQPPEPTPKPASPDPEDAPEAAGEVIELPSPPLDSPDDDDERGTQAKEAADGGKA